MVYFCKGYNESQSGPKHQTLSLYGLFFCVFPVRGSFMLQVVYCTCFKHLFHDVFTPVCHSLDTCVSVYSPTSMSYNNMNYQEIYYDREHIFLDLPAAEVLSFPLHTAADACSTVTLYSGKSSHLHLHIFYIFRMNVLGLGKKKQMKCSIAMWF